MSDRMTVFNPVGYPPQITQRGMAERPGSLAGRKAYLVDCRFDDGDKLIAQMNNWFAEHMPDLETRVVSKAGIYLERDPALYEEIQAEGGVAVVAVGH